MEKQIRKSLKEKDKKEKEEKEKQEEEEKKKKEMENKDQLIAKLEAKIDGMEKVVDGLQGKIKKQKRNEEEKKDELEEGEHVELAFDMEELNDDWIARKEKVLKEQEKEFKEMKSAMKKIKTIEACKDAYKAAELSPFDAAIKLPTLVDRLVIFAVEEGLPPDMFA